MGMVVSKLNAVAFARITGDIPQNVNFAIKVPTLVNFLEATIATSRPTRRHASFQSPSAPRRAARRSSATSSRIEPTVT